MNLAVYVIKLTIGKKMTQHDLNGNPECKHFDGEICYYYINNPNPKYPAGGLAFVCPEKSRHRRTECQLTS